MINTIEDGNMDRRLIEIFLKYFDEQAKVELYHYTTISALYNILKNREFWWGNTSTMNDKTELVDFINQLDSAVQVEIKDGAQKQRYYTLFDELKCRIRGEYPYAMSLSNRYDDAAQWERYADGAKGVCITFDTQKLCEAFCPHFFVFSRVYYDYDITKHEHYSIILDYLETGRINGFASIDGLVGNIISTAHSYKHRSFMSENEYRITSLGDTDPMLYKNISSEVAFELISGQIKRVLKIRYDVLCEKSSIDYQDLFKRITVGPRSEQSLYDLSIFCKQFGFEKLSHNIVTSECPLR